MKKLLFFSVLALFVGLQLNAQNNDAGLLKANEQAIGIATGIDYSILPVSMQYKRGFNVFNLNLPVNMGLDLTIPIFDFDLNDIRFTLISETSLLRKGNFEIRGGIDPVVCAIKMQTESMTSIGTNFHLFSGITTDSWNVGAEIKYNQMFTTFIHHTDKYKENVFSDVVDGWYKSTASNLRIGLLIDYKFNRMDLYLKSGISRTGTFQNYLFVPTFYAIIGVNRRF
jgi:hypothetical protein